MTFLDRADFMPALAQLFAAYGKPLSEDQADAYWQFLADLPLPTVLEGITAAGRRAGRYLPSVGQIREAIETASTGTPDTRPRGTCEWCEGTGWRYVAPRLVRPCECPIGAHRGRRAS